MNKTQIIVIVVVCVVLGLVSVYLSREEGEEYEAVASMSKRGLMENLDVNQVAEVKITKAKETVTLQKKGDQWTVTERSGYPADFTKLRDAVMDFKDLKKTQSINVPESELGTLELEKPGTGDHSGTLVELRNDKGGELASALLGKTHMQKSDNSNPFFSGGMPDGRFLKLEEGPAEVLVVSEPLREFTAVATDWLDKSFIKIDKIRSLTLRSPEKERSWQVKKEVEKDQFQLGDVPDGREADSGKIKQTASALKYFRFSDVLSGAAKPDQTGLDKAETLIVETFDHFSYELKLASANGKYFCAVKVSANIPETRPAAKDEKPEDKEKLDKEFAEENKKLEEKLDKEKFFEKWIYEIPKSKYETLVVSKKDLTKEKKVEAKPKPATSPKNTPKKPVIPVKTP